MTNYVKFMNLGAYTLSVEARTYCMVVRLSAAELEIVRQLAARDGFCPISTYARQLLMARAAEVLEQEEAET